MSMPNEFGLAGIIGMPVAHSRSPVIHNFWLKAHGIRGAYVPLAVKPERLKDALPGLVALGFRGCNVTMPHKQTAMPLLDRVNDTARRIGAVNTIVVEADGTLWASTMTATASSRACATPSRTGAATHGPVLILGAGGVVAGRAGRAARERRARNPDRQPHRREGGGHGGGVRPDGQGASTGRPAMTRWPMSRCWSTAPTRA